MRYPRLSCFRASEHFVLHGSTTMDFITYEQTEEILCRIADECDETEDWHGRIIVTTENWKDLLWLAENTTYCRKDISTMAENGYFKGSHPRRQSYHRRIQQAIMETHADFYMIDWDEDLIRYALDVVGMDIHSFDYRSLWRFMDRLPFLLSQGFHIDIQDHDGYTLLHRIVRCHHVRDVHQLLDRILPYEPELFLPDFRGETPLDVAKRFHPEIYERLLSLVPN